MRWDKKGIITGLLVVLTVVLVGCTTGNKDKAVVDVENDKADVTTETKEDGLVTQTEVWEETDEETGKEYRVEVIKDIEDGEVVSQYEVKTEVGTEEKVNVKVAEPVEEEEEVTE